MLGPWKARLVVVCFCIVKETLKHYGMRPIVVSLRLNKVDHLTCRENQEKDVNEQFPWEAI